MTESHKAESHKAESHKTESHKAESHKTESHKAESRITESFDAQEHRSELKMAEPAIKPLRPHHGMCFQFYQGKGYSSDFTDHMGKVLRAFEEAPEQMVRLVAAADLVCRHCPNQEAGTCTNQEKVKRYDEEVLRVCGILEGDVWPYQDFLKLVRERILDAGLRSAICGDCSWDDLCRQSAVVNSSFER